MSVADIMTDHVLASDGACLKERSDPANQRLRSENRRLRHGLEQLLQRCHAAESTNETLLELLNIHGIDCAHLCEPSLDAPITHQSIDETLSGGIGQDAISTHETQPPAALSTRRCADSTPRDMEVPSSRGKHRHRH